MPKRLSDPCYYSDVSADDGEALGSDRDVKSFWVFFSPHSRSVTVNLVCADDNSVDRSEVVSFHSIDFLFLFNSTAVEHPDKMANDQGERLQPDLYLCGCVCVERFISRVGAGRVFFL